MNTEIKERIIKMINEQQSKEIEETNKKIQELEDEIQQMKNNGTFHKLKYKGKGFEPSQKRRPTDRMTDFQSVYIQETGDWLVLDEYIHTKHYEECSRLFDLYTQLYRLCEDITDLKYFYISHKSIENKKGAHK